MRYAGREIKPPPPPMASMSPARNKKGHTIRYVWIVIFIEKPPEKSFHMLGLAYHFGKVESTIVLDK